MYLFTCFFLVYKDAQSVCVALSCPAIEVIAALGSTVAASDRCGRDNSQTQTWKARWSCSLARSSRPATPARMQSSSSTTPSTTCRSSWRRLVHDYLLTSTIHTRYLRINLNCLSGTCTVILILVETEIECLLNKILFRLLSTCTELYKRYGSA